MAVENTFAIDSGVTKGRTRGRPTFYPPGRTTLAVITLPCRLLPQPEMDTCSEKAGRSRWPCLPRPRHRSTVGITPSGIMHLLPRVDGPLSWMLSFTRQCDHSGRPQPSRCPDTRKQIKSQEAGRFRRRNQCLCYGHHAVPGEERPTSHSRPL